MPTVVLDERGRVTIPADIRKRLGLKPGSLLEVKVEKGAIILVPKRKISIRDLYGLAGKGVEVRIEDVEESLGELR